jgi:hypothetical protein
VWNDATNSPAPWDGPLLGGRSCGRARWREPAAGSAYAGPWQTWASPPPESPACVTSYYYYYIIIVTQGWVVNGVRRHAEPLGDNDPPQLDTSVTISEGDVTQVQPLVVET